MKINSTTGLVEWIPNLNGSSLNFGNAQKGRGATKSGRVNISIEVTDGEGITEQMYEIIIGNPEISTTDYINVNESDTVIINITKFGLPKPLYFVNDSRFTQNSQFSNIFSLQTNFTDSSNFIVEAGVKDLKLNITNIKKVNITVNDVANTECGSTLRNSCTATQGTLVTSSINNLKDGIYISSNNITFDCNNALLDGSGHYIINDAIKINGRSGVTLKNCNIQNYDDGVILSRSNLNNILENSIKNSNRGILLVNSSYNNISYSLLSFNNATGISLFNSKDNLFSNNNITFNKNGGIDLRSDSDRTTVRENNFISNNGTGISIVFTSSSNKVYKNNIINNEKQASDSGNLNVFDFNSEGNFWSDHICDDPDQDGICNNPYIFNLNQDNFPFANPLL